MNAFKKVLLTSVASLTLAFGGAVNAQQAQNQAPSPAQTQTQKNDTVSVARVQRDYVTRASQRLAALEKRINASRPSGTPRIAFVDLDQVSTTLQLRQLPLQQFPGLVTEYLGTKNVTGLAPQELVAISQVTFSMTAASFAPQALRPGLTGDALAQASAVVVPYNPNFSAQDYMAKSFQLRSADGEPLDALDGAKLNVQITREQMADIVDAKGAWRAFDTRYLPGVTVAQGFDQVMALHRTEVFSDLGALMQTVKDGGSASLVSEYANFRATAVAATEGLRAKTYESDNINFYGAIVGTTYPALFELQARIEKLGVENFRKLTPDQLRDMAYDITEKTALTPEQATHLSGVAALGAEYFRTLQQNKVDPAAIDAAVKFVTAAYEFKAAIAEKTIAPQDAGEALKDMMGGGTPSLYPYQIYDFLQAKIMGDKDVVAHPGDVKYLLQARKKLVDESRDLLDKHPEKADAIRQIIQGVFMSDPLLRTEPPRPQTSPSKRPPPLLQA
ncbi:MAG TPA: hypothetical protein VEF76_00630 [Patescibacteria group bacterium]|nr:hypothetical protein [Patescibacteria group bacterium]